MAKFKISQLDAKLGLTIEKAGTWTRVDRGITLQNVDVVDGKIDMKEVRGAFEKAQTILLEEINKVVSGISVEVKQK